MAPQYTPETQTPVAEDWYATAFGELYPVIYAHRSVEAAAPEALFALEALRLPADAEVLDLCCGNGRHMVHFAKRTPRICGLDYSPQLLRDARRNLGGAGRVVRGDMRALPFRTQFDGVVNFFTSFGYFPTDRENRQVVAEVARVLKPRGRFFIDYLDSQYVVDHLASESVQERHGYRIEERRWIDHERKRVNKRMRVCKDGKEVANTGESVRLYDREEMTAFLASEGLEIDAVYGNYEGAAHGADQPRMIILGHKAA